MSGGGDAPGAGGSDGARAGRRVRCPTCGKATGWSGNPDRPFCSARCRLVDLGVWLDEGYRIADESGDDVS